VVQGAKVEIAKIEVRQTELVETITSLRKEAVSFERRLPALERSLHELSTQLENIVAPNLRTLRKTYTELVDKRGTVREALNLHETLRDLEGRKARLEEADGRVDPGNVSDVDLSTSTVDKFASLILEILRAWHFPEVDRVHFDMKARDLVINGKARTSFGKGLRAITQAAFTIGLLEHCRRQDTPHPGMVVLDSPLLSYREPESAADDLRGTDLNSHFYHYLQTTKEDCQMIIIENTDPPPDVEATLGATKFTGRSDVGRYGLFSLRTEPSTKLVS
jgi:hypothetical protein